MTTDSSPSPAAPNGKASRSRAWPLVLGALGLAALLLGAALYVFERARSLPGEAVAGLRSLAEDARSLAAAFRTGTVTTAFASYAAELQGDMKLQVATLRQVEVFERTDSAAVLWGSLQLPDVVVEARVPVEYTYTVDLSQRWSFTQEGDVVVVVAPPLTPNAPALDVSALRFHVRQGSLMRDETAVTEALRQGLTQLSRERARQSLPVVREMARRQVEEFVAVFLAQRFSEGSGRRVRVRFTDEAPPAPPQLAPPRG
jgi:hypothetical protein